MQLPVYITEEEVRRVCRELDIRDWTTMEKAEVTEEEAAMILANTDTAGLRIPLEDFRVGLEVELEHGTRYPAANVTNNHPLLTARIVVAHLLETLDYYKRLEVAELEGDLHKAMLGNNPQKAADYYRRLAAARLALDASQTDDLG
ncbi:DUF5661 family protein [Syntrophotalea acetylenica]|jgi:hypothetical protein|uniref:Uncharacterized protein n=1 Tax=Syntrophotalea acetylenica TaxID=29542 RepID=A0A1L3GGY4_SYNAC|nr:DUF5661 family protein [Syntrophotalea acetylenica]APG25150.1 hypothetical protein A7E75_09055 [Syntrophotalea acetylenica]APG43219.1 hypothetical protein A6070_03030 [Syntrophotalea acetylenica]MDY0261420.1 DUF5661 family protein [Syntrophotalea acetylenica]